ncbi:MAG: hypothetical protein SGARI_001944 [Bacillariaceae sp.]
MKTSAVPISDVWKANRLRYLAQESEIERPVPDGWIESEKFPKKVKLINPDKLFKSGSGGGVPGPNSRAMDATRDASLTDLVLMFAPMSMLERIVRETNRYANEDCVKPRSVDDIPDDDSLAGDDDGEDDDIDPGSVEPAPKRRKISRIDFVVCDPDDPYARKRYHNKSRKWTDLTVGSLLAW